MSGPPSRSPYVAVPRDLASVATFRQLSRDAQWLLQHLERDPYRLKCGVFVLNERLIARDAKATAPEVSNWFDELCACGWVVFDDDTGEGWLAHHMAWDNTLANRNHAVAVLRDVRRVGSERLAETIRHVVYDRHPTLRPNADVDPGWSDEEDHSDPAETHAANAIADGIPSGPNNAIADGTPDTTPNSQARNPSTDPQPPEPEPDPPEPDPRNPEPAHGARGTGGDRCERCDDTGVIHGEGGGSIGCDQCQRGADAERGHLRVVGGDQ